MSRQRDHVGPPKGPKKIMWLELSRTKEAEIDAKGKTRGEG